MMNFDITAILFEIYVKVCLQSLLYDNRNAGRRTHKA